jgi:transposase
MTIKITDRNAVLVLQDEIRRSEAARYDHRLHAVLLVARGMSCPKVAEVLGSAERTIRHWVQRFNDEGLPGLVETDIPGRPRRLSEKQLEVIDKILRRDPADAGMSTAIWDGKTLAAYIQRTFKLRLSVRQCQRVFKHLGFRLCKPRPMIARSDPKMQKDFKKK